jgi:hypothetical protein
MRRADARLADTLAADLFLRRSHPDLTGTRKLKVARADSRT